MKRDSDNRCYQRADVRGEAVSEAALTTSKPASIIQLLTARKLKLGRDGSTGVCNTGNISSMAAFFFNTERPPPHYPLPFFLNTERPPSPLSRRTSPWRRCNITNLQNLKNKYNSYMPEIYSPHKANKI